ncbi:MAG: hypothetical protein EAZ95_03470 [Bacteroidetes bacterium]|nr:MAG: hypothetical protein EAZ95_03470 [Bacteroidota bacterium]
MNNYLYFFEFRSGLFESCFYQQLRAKSEREAILDIVSSFLHQTEADTAKLLHKALGLHWTVEQFWKKMDTCFSNGYEAFDLKWVKKIDFDLNA